MSLVQLLVLFDECLMSEQDVADFAEFITVLGSNALQVLFILKQGILLPLYSHFLLLQLSKVFVPLFISAFVLIVLLLFFGYLLLVLLFLLLVFLQVD